MRKPKWQKARILHCLSHPEIVGREVWTAGKPIVSDGVDEFTYRYFSPRPIVFTSINYIDNRRVAFDPSSIERLARCDDDFADDVPILTWEEFLNA